MYISEFACGVISAYLVLIVVVIVLVVMFGKKKGD